MRGGGQALHLRDDLFRPTRQPLLRRIPLQLPGADRRGPGPGNACGGRHCHRCARFRHSGCHRLFPGEWHPLRRWPDQEPLRGSHLHPAHPGDARGGYPGQTQPPTRCVGGQAGGGDRRFDRARHHQSQVGAGPARCRGPRSAHADQFAAGHPPLFLRHRHRHPGPADRCPAQPR